MKSRSSERGVTLRFPLIEAWSELLLLSSAHQLGQRDGDDEGAAVEHLLDERAETQKDETRNPGDQEIDGDGRAPRVETSWRDAGRSKEGGGEGRQLITDARYRVRRALSPCVRRPAQAPKNPEAARQATRMRSVLMPLRRATSRPRPTKRMRRLTAVYSSRYQTTAARAIA